MSADVLECFKTSCTICPKLVFADCNVRLHQRIVQEYPRIIRTFRGEEMAVLLQEYSTEVIAADGTTYTVLSYGEERADGTWTGWLEFEPTDATLPTLVTGQETSQPNRTSIEYWATGLEPVYFQGAFERARDNQLA